MTANNKKETACTDRYTPFFVSAIQLECLAVAAEDVDQLVLDHLLDSGASGLQILTRIKLGGILVEELTESRS